MARSPFSARSSFPVLARIPLLPAADSRETVPGADELLAEGMFLASRQVDSEADLPGRNRSRMAITRRDYEIRAQLRQRGRRLGQLGFRAVVAVHDSRHTRIVTSWLDHPR